MKKIVISSLVLASILVLSSCSLTSSQTKGDRMERVDAMVKDGAMMKKDDGAIAPKDTMMKKDIMTTVGAYTGYSASAVTVALAEKKNVILFFHASWCPTCKSADKNFLSETPPANTVVLKVDFDSNIELRKKYGVTYQHTFVSLNADETLKKKASGVSHFADLTELN